MALFDELTQAGKLEGRTPEQLKSFKILSDEAETLSIDDLNDIRQGLGLRIQAEELVTPSFLELGEQVDLPSGQEIFEATELPVEVGGAIIGGAVGAATPIPGGTAIGSGLGFAAAKEARRGIGTALGFEDPIETIPEALVQTGETLREAAIGESIGLGILGTGRGLVKVSRAVAATRLGKKIRQAVDLAKSFLPQKPPEINQDIVEFLIKAEEEGFAFTPAEILNVANSPFAPVAKTFESLFNALPLTTNQIKTFDLLRVQKLIARREELLLGRKAPEEVISIGREIQRELNKFLKNKVKIASEGLEAEIGAISKEESKLLKLGEGKILQLKDNILQKLGSDEGFDSLGAGLKEAVENKTRIEKAAKDKLFLNVQDLLPQKGQDIVPTVESKAVANSLLGQELSLGAGFTDENFIKRLSGFADPDSRFKAALKQNADISNEARVQIENILDAQPARTWEALVEIRKRVGDLIDSEADTLTGNISNKGRKLIKFKKAIEGDMETFSDSLGGGVKEAFDIAQAASGNIKKTITENPQIRKLIRAGDSSVINMLIKPGLVDSAKAVKDILGPEGLVPFKKGLTRIILGADKPDKFSPQFVKSQLNKFGSDTLRQFYSVDEIAQLRGLADDGAQIEELSKGIRGEAKEFVKKRAAQLKKLGNDVTLNPFFKDIVKAQSPEAVVDIALNPGTLKNVRRLSAIIPPRTMKALKEAFLEKKLLGLAEDGRFLPENINVQIRKFGEDNLKQLFPDIMKDIKLLAEVGTTTTRREERSLVTASLAGFAEAAFVLVNPVLGITAALPRKAVVRLWLAKPSRDLLINMLKKSKAADKATGAAKEGIVKSFSRDFDALMKIISKEETQVGRAVGFGARRRVEEEFEGITVDDIRKVPERLGGFEPQIPEITSVSER